MFNFVFNTIKQNIYIKQVNMTIFKWCTIYPIKQLQTTWICRGCVKWAKWFSAFEYRKCKAKIWSNVTGY